MRSKTSNDLPFIEVSSTLPATAEHLGSVYASLSQFWAELQRSHPSPPDETWRAQFHTAVGEIVSNIIRHAYTSTSAAGEISITIDGFHDRVEALFQDHGVPYSASPIAEARIPADRMDVVDLPEGGWGLALTLAAVDHLSYTREADTNYWRIIKKL
ncbi:MAG TPA: ATP-binding protein [Chloroflexota bacterium]|jgi:anti-sigma regulatory factor (Ser/Thr protein kinase)